MAISRVPGPLHIEVACTRPCGQQYILALDNAVARLAAHEIDHLSGRLYTSRMRDGASPIPVSDYPAPGTHARTRLPARPARISPCYLTV
jgi:hypothetical protein